MFLDVVELTTIRIDGQVFTPVISKLLEKIGPITCRRSEAWLAHYISQPEDDEPGYINDIDCAVHNCDPVALYLIRKYGEHRVRRILEECDLKRVTDTAKFCDEIINGEL